MEIDKEYDTEFRSCLMLVADSPEELRPVDVDRVLDAAEDMCLLTEFAGWLLDHDLLPRTRELVSAVVWRGTIVEHSPGNYRQYLEVR